jgi:hypothetical protein
MSSGTISVQVQMHLCGALFGRLAGAWGAAERPAPPHGAGSWLRGKWGSGAGRGSRAFPSVVGAGQPLIRFKEPYVAIHAATASAASAPAHSRAVRQRLARGRAPM